MSILAPNYGLLAALRLRPVKVSRRQNQGR